MLHRFIIRSPSSFRLLRRFTTANDSPSPHEPSTFPADPCPSMIDENRLPPLPEITNDLIHHLEQLSLVRFSDEAAVKHLRTALRYAQRLDQIDTDRAEPMISVLEDEALRLREDESISSIDSTPDRSIVLRNAKKSVEDMYFVAPVGNVPLEERQDKLGAKEIKKLVNA